MLTFPPAVQRLIRELSKLPSIGEKSATRLAYHLVHNDPELCNSLAEALRQAGSSVRLCSQCFFLTENELCAVCRNAHRDQSVICAVEKPIDVMAIERVGEFKGLYHVLHGLWAPLRGQGPESMRIEELMARVANGVVKEVILATSSTVDGDSTALYLARLLAQKGVKSTRLAQGMPKGGELEYADDVTLSRALSGRSSIG